MKLSIIIPTYNEEITILTILNKVKSVELIDNISKEIIVVNDCSSDNTPSILEKYKKDNKDLEIIIFNQKINKGKGAAIRKGIELSNGDFIIIQDADTEYDPQNYNLLLKPILDGFADVVYGSRFVGGKPHRILFFWHSIGNKLLTFLSNLLSNLNLTDMETGYKLFKSEFIKKINLKENRFGFEPEVTAKISKIKGIRVYEVGISYYGRTYNEGKKIIWTDGLKAIFCIIKYNIFSRK